MGCVVVVGVAVGCCCGCVGWVVVVGSVLAGSAWRGASVVDGVVVVVEGAVVVVGSWVWVVVGVGVGVGVGAGVVVVVVGVCGSVVAGC